MKINNIDVTLQGEASEDELIDILEQLQSRHKRRIISAEVIVDGEYLDVKFKYERVKFERIRRITGYLVGTTARWGDGKRAEEKDRVKHG